MAGWNSPDPTSATGPGMPRSIPAHVRNCAPVTRTQRWTLAAAILGSGIVFLDGTVVNIALKRIGQELPTSFLGVFEGQAYVQSGYLAVLAALLIIAGALADVYGRRRIFVIGLLGFGATSILCGIAPTLEFLVLARILQGAAGALLVPGSLAIITATFDGASRARAFGLWASATSTLTLLGPIVGGLIVDKLSWRLAFLLNIPLVAIAVWASIRHVAESRDPEADHRFDWIGAIVGAGAIGGVGFWGVPRPQRARGGKGGVVFGGGGVFLKKKLPQLPVCPTRALCPAVLFPFQ